MRTLANNKDRRIVEDKKLRWWFIDKYKQQTHQVFMYISDDFFITEK